MADIKCKPVAGVVFMVIAHKVGSLTHGNSILIELFKTKDTAMMWKEKMEKEGFFSTVHRKGVRYK